MYKSFVSVMLSSVAAAEANDHFLGPKVDYLPVNTYTAISVNTVAPCQYVTQSAFFNLAGIANGKLNDNREVDKRNVGDDLVVTLNFCEAPMTTFGNCLDTEAYAFIEDKKSNQCFGVRSEDDKIDTTGTEIRNENGVINGIGLTYVSGNKACVANPEEKYTLLVNVVCRTQSEDSELHFINVTGDACHPILNYESKTGCPVFTMDAFSQFINKYYYLWGAALVLMGVILAFFGNRFLNFVIFLTFFFASFCILGSIFFYMFMDQVKKDWAKWLALGAIIAVSALLGT